MATSQDSIELFVYGTLMNPKVFRTVTKSEALAPPTPLTLSGFKRVTVKSQVYPALVPCKDASVHGLLLNVSRKQLETLDVFETDDYKRVDMDGVDVYLWNKSILGLDNREWDYENFVKNDLEGWLELQMPVGNN